MDLSVCERCFGRRGAEMGLQPWKPVSAPPPANAWGIPTGLHKTLSADAVCSIVVCLAKMGEETEMRMAAARCVPSKGMHHVLRKKKYGHEFGMTLLGILTAIFHSRF